MRAVGVPVRKAKPVAHLVVNHAPPTTVTTVKRIEPQLNVGILPVEVIWVAVVVRVWPPKKSSADTRIRVEAEIPPGPGSRMSAGCLLCSWN